MSHFCLSDPFFASACRSALPFGVIIVIITQVFFYKIGSHAAADYMYTLAIKKSQFKTCFYFNNPIRTLFGDVVLVKLT